MTDRTSDLHSDPAAEHLADPVPSEAALQAADARSGGDVGRAPHSLHQAELTADDEDSPADEWDDEARL